MRNRLVFAFIFGILCITSPVFSQPKPEQLAPIREEFLYEVHYGPLRLGFVEILPVTDTTFAGNPALKYKMVMRSNPRLLFIGNKREHYYSVFTDDGNKTYGLMYKSDDLDDAIENENYMKVDLDSSVVHMEFRPELDEYYSKTLPWIKHALLGPDIYYFSRFFAGKDTLVKTPIYVDTTLQEISLKYENKGELKKYPVFQDSVKTFRLNGDAPFTGPFGFNGKFTAWFATDSLRIPLEAHADVWIGFVKIKLIGYRRLDSLPKQEPPGKD
ncbi:DUF3108 domain-containing protein [bacterium]|nr:MAG: DUF3108 domain-containing protein [bacterium]